MKYPQLVSSRAVNEISDWLIKRLEELDIERVYSRLLLSLLHTPLKLNALDLDDIPQLKDLKQPYHLLTKNNEELKRLAAVQSLMEVSSVDQNKSNIVNLVDELYSKLRQIENGEESALIGGKSQTTSKFYKSLKKIKRNKTPENPAKNYYIAFPALSSNRGGNPEETAQQLVKEATFERNSKSLCWSGLMSSKESHLLAQQGGAERMARASTHSGATKRTSSKNHRLFYNKRNVQPGIFYESNFLQKKPLPAAKKKQKRQRNYFGSNKTKNEFNDSQQIYLNEHKFGNTEQQLPHHVIPPYTKEGLAPWDMEFQGQWEMDRDLIGEFIATQDGGEYESNNNNLVQLNRNFSRELADKYDGHLKVQSFYLPDNEDDDDHISIKCLPSELIEDAADDFVEEPQPQNNYDQIEEIFNQTINFQIKQWEQQPINVKETQTINTFKSKFDASVKALWDNTNLTDEMGSLSLFNFQAVPEPVPVVTEPLANKYYCLKIIDYDCNNNQGGSNEKFIKSGTNLQLSIWSENEDSEPQSLTNPNEVIEDPQSSFDQQVVDEVGDKMSHCWASSLNVTKINYWTEDNNSLFIHCENSRFQQYQSFGATAPLGQPTEKPKDPEVESSNANENLLTSERTHFCPIKQTYSDGHTFLIDDSYEPVEYERSPSGSLMWNRKRYMKWNADAREALADLADNKSISSNDTIGDEEFVIKFCINENEKYCQTEDLPVPDAEDYFNYYNKQNCYVDQLLQKSADGNRWRFTNASSYNSDDSCSYFSTNRVKKPQQTTNEMLLSSNSSSSSISTITSFNDSNENCVDPFEAWRHMDTCQLDFCTQNFAPSLWEHCTGCGGQASGVHSEEKSIPANRLLKDELREEAEELMMDLQSMQNLYVAGDLYEEQAVDDCVLMDETSDAKFYDQQFYGITKLMQEIISPQLLTKMFTPNTDNRNDLQLDGFDEQTAFARIMKWPTGVMEEELPEASRNMDKYMQLFKLLNNGRFDLDDINNNNSIGQVGRRDRKRRHSTCQNFLEKKKLTPGNSFFLETTESFPVHIVPGKSGKLLNMDNINLDKIIMFNDDSIINEIKCDKDTEQNYYKNILQQQHALIKQMDSTRPLTR